VSDNLFDRLAELLQSAGPVNWRLAAQIAESIAGPDDPIDPWLAEEYQELGRTASMLVGRVLETASLPSIQPLDPRTWASAGVEGYAYLAEPLAAKLSSGPGPEPLMAQLGPALIGLQVGGLVGAMAREVLGDFDAGLPPSGTGGSLVVPRLEVFAASEGLDDRQVRLWASIRETAHQAQMAIPWVTGHLAGLVTGYLEGLEFRPEQLREGLQGLDDPEALERLAAQPGGLAGFSAGPELDSNREEITAAVAFLDGHGRATTASVAGELIPDLPAIETAAEARHAGGGPEEILRQMLGISIDAELGAAAAAFCEDVTRRWGDSASERLWSGPGAWPSLDELQDPVGWAARALLPDEI
jgi:putative hydrolase